MRMTCSSRLENENDLQLKRRLYCFGAFRSPPAMASVMICESETGMTARVKIQTFPSICIFRQEIIFIPTASY